MSGFCQVFTEIIRQHIRKDPFFLRLTGLDLKARNSQTRSDYHDRYCASLEPLSFLEAALVDYPSFTDSRLPEWVCALDRILRPLMPASFPPAHQWVRPVICWQMFNERVEEGLPHTLQRCIVLPSRFREEMSEPNFVKLLQHEYLHVLQRYYKSSFDDLYRRRYGMVPCKEVEIRALIGSSWIRQRRTNPDAQCWYIQRRPLSIVSQFYMNSQPRSLMDSQVLEITVTPNAPLRIQRVPEGKSQQLEHPHERLATELIVFS